MADWFTLDREVVNLEYLGSLVWAAFDLNNGFALTSGAPASTVAASSWWSQ